MDSTITPQKLFESGKYRDIETASEVFILMKKIESLEGILESARKLLGKTLLSDVVDSGAMEIHDFRRKP